MIEINNLVKKYQSKTIIDIDHYVFENNTCYLIVGSNGSGKTTLIKTLVGIIIPTSGIIEIDNVISYVPEKFYYPESCKVKHLLEAFGYLYDIKKEDISNMIDRHCQKWKIDKNKTINQLSKGMQQKVLLIQALMYNAPIFIFDEPLNGLDAVSQSDFLMAINELRSLNKIIIIATHYPEYYHNCYDVKLILIDGTLINENI